MVTVLRRVLAKGPLKTVTTTSRCVILKDSSKVRGCASTIYGDSQNAEDLGKRKLSKPEAPTPGTLKP